MLTVAASLEKTKKSWLGLEAPRYTSYPSAHHFSAEFDSIHHEEWLGEIGRDTSISVYFHIPFCRDLCSFCGCHTKITKHYDPIAAYVQTMLKEIELLRCRVGSKGKLVNIHFGGGSPNLLNSEDLRSILYAINSVFELSMSNEMAIEIDPRTTTVEKILLYEELGFTRVSLGIQDFDPIVQQTINRIQPYHMVASLMSKFREVGIQQINCDLIYGLPHQTPERFRDTLIKTVALDPARIALFSYAHMPELKKHQRIIDMSWLPTDSEKLTLYVMASKILEENGYTSIGIDHFSKIDDTLASAQRDFTLKRNFQGYTTDSAEILVGIGNSAISQFPKGYVQNSQHSVMYRNLIENNRLPSVRGWHFKNNDHVHKRVIDELMCFMYVNLEVVCNAYKLDISYFQLELEKLRKEPYQEIVKIDGQIISINTSYRMAARVVASVFDQYKHAAAGRYSKVA
ncbi:MAG: oxygen-independent coproporphyrinogen III oxidase [Alphaproteobacteria bacterium]